MAIDTSTYKRILSDKVWSHIKKKYYKGCAVDCDETCKLFLADAMIKKLALTDYFTDAEEQDIDQKLKCILDESTKAINQKIINPQLSVSGVVTPPGSDSGNTYQQTLTYSGSSTKNILEYKWEFIDGNLADASGLSELAVTYPSPDVAQIDYTVSATPRLNGLLAVKLTVTDEDGDTAYVNAWIQMKDDGGPSSPVNHVVFIPQPDTVIKKSGKFVVTQVDSSIYNVYASASQYYPFEFFRQYHYWTGAPLDVLGTVETVVIPKLEEWDYGVSGIYRPLYNIAFEDIEPDSALLGIIHLDYIKL
jgi:hypothetical protein